MTEPKGTQRATERMPARPGGLRQAAHPYSSDAITEAREARRLRWLGSGAALAAAGFLLLAASRSTSGHDVVVARFLVFASPCIPLAGVCIGLLIISTKHSAAAVEARRLSRQLGVLDAYVARMPRNARSLVLASLAPRFFPQYLSADDEMLLDHAFPPADQLLAAIDPETYEAMELEDED